MSRQFESACSGNAVLTWERMLRHLSLIPIVFLLGTAMSCSKLDKNANCLNEKSACFKEDKTAPQLAAGGALSPTQGAIVSVLSTVDLQFSEELNNPQPSDFVFSGAANMTVNAVQQIDRYTYRLVLTQNSLTSGTIYLDFPNLRDYNGNKITGSTTVTYIGNVDIPVTIDSVSHYGVSGAGGYPQIDISWHYTYIPPAASNTVYNVKLTTGSTDCNSATAINLASPSIPAGSAATSGTVYSFSITPANITLLGGALGAVGPKVILICVDNAIYNKHGTGTISAVYDTTAPTVLSLWPSAGNYAAPQAMTFSCSDNSDRIIYRVETNIGQPTDPAAPTDPGFTGGVVNADSTLYNPSNKPLIPFSGNTTRSIFKYRCIDVAGNVSNVITTGVYRVNDSFPSVTLVNFVRTGTSTPIAGLSSVGYTSGTINWSSNQVGQAWQLRTDALECSAGGTVVASGTTPGIANQMVSTVITDTSPNITAAGSYVLRLCVTNGTDWAQASFNLLRDDSAPAAPTVNIAAGNFGAVQNLVFSCSATDDNEDKVAYSVATLAGATAPAAPTAPDFDANGVVSSGTLQTTPLATPNQSTSVYRAVCIDRAGNKSPALTTAAYRVDSILPTITIVSNTHDALSSVAGYTSTTLSWRSSRGGLPFEIRKNSTNCTDGTVLNSPASVSGTTPVDTNQIITSTFDNVNFGTEGSYTLLVCVQNYINQWGYTQKVVLRDNTPPSFGGLTSITNAGSGNFTLGWAAATDSGSGVAYYNIYGASSVAGPFNTVSATALSTALSATVTVADPLLPYFYVAGVVDSAGNETKVTLVVFSTKPTLRLVVSGLGSGKSFTVADGTGATQSVSANVVAPGTIFATTLALNQTYALSLSQPTGQSCGIREKQFGILTGDLTVNINCVNGFGSSQGVNAEQAARLKYLLYRGKVSSLYSNATANVLLQGITIVNGNLYFAAYNSATLQTQLYICPAASCASFSTVGAAISGRLRHLASDGTNIYATEIINPTTSNLVKIDIGTGARTALYALNVDYPSGLALDAANHMLYISVRTQQYIKRFNYSTGAALADITTTGYAHNEGMVLLKGDLYIASADSTHCILKVANPLSAPVLSVYAGSCGTTASGFTDGALAEAKFNLPHGITADGTDLYVAEFGNKVIRRIDTLKGLVSTIAGSGSAGTSDGTGAVAGFQNTFDIITDGRALYLAESVASAGKIRKIVDSSLEGYSPLAGGTSDYASDFVNPAAGTWVGTETYATGRYGTDANGAASFNGASYVRTKSGTPAMDAVLTFAAWVNPADLAATRAVMGTTNFKFMLNVTASGGLAFQNWFGGGAGTNRMAGSAAGLIAANKWTHVAYVYRPGSDIAPGGRVYINGHDATVYSSNAFGTSDAITVPITIGHSTLSGTSNYMNGLIADARVYTRALSEGEINELAQDAAAALVGSGFNTAATGLLSHFTFEPNSGSPSLGDAGALGIALTNNGVTGTTTGKDGEADGVYNYNGAADFSFNSGSAGLPKLDHPRTLCAWVKPAQFPAAIQSIVRYADGGIEGSCMHLAMINLAGVQAITFGTCGDNTGGPIEYANLSHELPLNTWSHVCGSLNAAKVVEIYVNGISRLSTSVVTNWQTASAGNLYIASFNGGGYPFPGAIDDVRIYNNALSNAQIRQLATQIPNGLVARYDFNGDRSDVSGFGQSLSNSGAALTADRFSAANAAAYFTSSAFMQGTSDGFPVGSSARTVCAWTKPDTLFNGTFSEVVMYGTSGSATGWGFGMDAAGGLPNGRIFILDTSGDMVYGNPHGLGIWRHICAAYNGSTQTLYVDGNAVANKSLTLATTSGSSMYIGRGIFGPGDYFNGAIDDVRVYARALSLAEVRALSQQPNKRIFVTASTYSGNLKTTAPSGTTGIAGADAKCNADANKPATGNYKAMLADGLSRRACSSAYCGSSSITEGIDWVTRPNITYVRPTTLLPVFTANWNGVFDFSTAANNIGFTINFANAVSATAATPWTGMTYNWTNDAACGHWDGIATSDDKGVFGDATSTFQPAAIGGALYQFWTGNTTGTLVSCLVSSYPLYCVEQ